MPSKVKITVLKRLDARDIFGEDFVKELSNESAYICDQVEDGQEYIFDGKVPEGFCPWAWHDIQREVSNIRNGGSYHWIKKEGTVYSSCTDGVRPVIFKIERIEE